MKTSFYFVLWILIYPLLGLLHNNFIDNNAFFIALAIVWGLSWLLNRAMPETFAYETALEAAPVMEEIYTGRIDAFIKRVSRDTTVEVITALYFLVTTIVSGYVAFSFGGVDWFVLIVFGLFAYGAISRSVTMVNVRSRLKADPTAENCAQAAAELYRLNYQAYHEMRTEHGYEAMFPPKPRHFVVFQAFSILFAALSTILGLFYIVKGILTIPVDTSIGLGALASMYFLYGSLAALYGVKDLIACGKFR